MRARWFDTSGARKEMTEWMAAAPVPACPLPTRRASALGPLPISSTGGMPPPSLDEAHVGGRRRLRAQGCVGRADRLEHFVQPPTRLVQFLRLDRNLELEVAELAGGVASVPQPTGHLDQPVAEERDQDEEADGVEETSDHHADRGERQPLRGEQVDEEDDGDEPERDVEGGELLECVFHPSALGELARADVRAEQACGMSVGSASMPGYGRQVQTDGSSWFRFRQRLQYACSKSKGSTRKRKKPMDHETPTTNSTYLRSPRLA
eukprot:scaffold25427_cov112-Isochrysis_galbana.AAC.4